MNDFKIEDAFVQYVITFRNKENCDLYELKTNKKSPYYLVQDEKKIFNIAKNKIGTPEEIKIYEDSFNIFMDYVWIPFLNKNTH